MSIYGNKAVWRALWAGPPLAPQVREAVANRIVSWVISPLWLLIIGTSAAILLTLGLDEPSRLIPSAFIALALLYLRRLAREERWVDAAAALSGLMFIGIVFAVLANGVHAPAYAGGLVLLVLVVPLFGGRVGLCTLTALLLLGLAVIALEHAHIRSYGGWELALTRVSLYAMYGLFTVAMLAKTSKLLTDALYSAEREKREADAARAAEAARDLAFHAVFDQATTGMLLLTAAGEITQSNANAARLLGESESALDGRALQELKLWSSAQRRELNTALFAVASGRAHQQELAVEQDRVYQLRLSPFYDHAGELGHLLVELTDLTDLIATRALLAEARRLEALGKLSAGLAHDINNMLAAVSGGSELAWQGHVASHSDEVRSGLEVVDSSVRRAAALIRQLLAFGSRDPLASAHLDLNRLVRDMAKLFARTLQRSIVLEVHTSDEPIWVRGDKAALENALLNLALNAQDAMPEGGKLIFEVSTRTLNQDECAHIDQPIEPGPFASVRVIDTGSGMSSDVRERIFEPFFTTKTRGQNTGLGLPAVHGTMRSHGGAILVHSHPGIGSTFELLLPAARSVVHEADSAPHSIVAPKRLHARVLVAEDEPLVRSIVVKMLTAAGCEVHAVNDGQRLLDELAASAHADVVVTDLMMPGLSGGRLLSAIETLRPGCPLIVMTGYTGEDIAELLTGVCRHELLRKPFTQAQLLRALESVLGTVEPQPHSARVAEGMHRQR